MTKTLLFRVDASPEMGIGHVMRCLALAQAWNHRGGHSVFAMSSVTSLLEARLRTEVIDIVHLSAEPGSDSDALQTTEVGRSMRASWVVLDGYHFGKEYQHAIKAEKNSLVVLDDYAHVEHYYADIILNQGGDLYNSEYKTEPYTRLLLGTKYALLREEFLKYVSFQRDLPAVAEKLLITLGGSDLKNNTLKIIEALKYILPHLEVKIILGPDNSHYTSVLKELQGVTHNVEILRNVDNMAVPMLWADLAVSAGGLTVWELAFLGLPSLLCTVAENQKRVVASLAEKGFCGVIENIEGRPAEEISEEISRVIKSRNMRGSMSESARAAVDGRGGYRVVQELTAGKAS